MKKFFVLLLLISFTSTLPVYSKAKSRSVGDKGSENIEAVDETTSDESGAKKVKSNKKNKNQDEMDTRGYYGTLPDISDHFKMFQEQEAEPTFEVNENFNDPYKIKPAPRDNPSFINIILKQEKSSQYLNEINELIFLIEKIQRTIEDDANLQVFCARAYNLDKYVEFFRNKYQNRPEISYASYKQVMQLNTELQALAALRREKEVYSPYVLSSSNGNAFSESNIELQNEYLLENIKSTLIILKEAK